MAKAKRRYKVAFTLIDDALDEEEMTLGDIHFYVKDAIEGGGFTMKSIVIKKETI